MLLVSSCLRLAIIFSTIDSSPRLSRLSISRTLYLLNYHPFVSFIRRMDVARLIVRINSLFFLGFVGFLRWLGGTLEQCTQHRPQHRNLTPRLGLQSSIFRSCRSWCSTVG